MRATGKYDVSQLNLNSPQKRLFNAHSKKGSWKAVGDELGINWRYVYDYVLYNKLSRNPVIRKKLLGKKSIDDHLFEDRIQDMPPPLLKWAFENRREM